MRKMSTVLMLDKDEYFSLSANVTNPGYQSMVLRGYLTERRSDGLYAAPLLPQLFYGVDGTQLSSWRQYISGTGEQTLLSRSGGEPSVPREELYWRRVGNDVSAPAPVVTPAPLGVYSVGQKRPGSLMPLGQVVLSTEETEKGKFYEIHIDTDGIPDPSRAVNAIVVGLRNQGVETVWASADARKIRLQIAGSPTSWPIILGLLPSILSLMGIAVILISTYLVISMIPSWMLALLAVGVLAVMVIPSILPQPAKG